MLRCVAALALLVHTGFAVRVAVVDQDSAGSNESGASASGGLLQARALVGVGGRYRLEERGRLWSLDSKKDDKDLPAVLNKFEGAEKLARGSFGEAWKAHDTNTDKDVVIKLFFRKDAEDREAEFGDEEVKYLHLDRATSDERKVLESEEWACEQVQRIMWLSVKGGVRHPGAEHLCRCIEENMGPPQAYVVQDFCGESLEDSRPKPQEDGKKQVEVATAITEQLLSALDLMGRADESKTYIHHDLKPENVGVIWGADGSPSVRIIDWGALRVLGPTIGWASSGPGECIWNQAYAPPEWRWNQDLPCATRDYEYAYDMFGVGAMFAVLLTGAEIPKYTKPFGYLDWDSMANKCSHKVPQAAVDLVRKLTETAPWDRPRPAAAVLMSGLGPHARRWLPGAWRFDAGGPSGSRDDPGRGYEIAETEGGKLELAVLSKGEVRGRVIIGEKKCGWIHAGTQGCCQVNVDYTSRKWRLFGWNPFNVTFAVRLCPLSYWSMRFHEVAQPDSTIPRHFVGEVTTFLRAPLPERPLAAADSAV